MQAMKEHANLQGKNIFFDMQPPMSLFKEEISNCILKEWTEEWHADLTCKRIKIFYPNPDRSKAKQLLNLVR